MVAFGLRLVWLRGWMFGLVWVGWSSFFDWIFNGLGAFRVFYRGVLASRSQCRMLVPQPLLRPSRRIAAWRRGLGFGGLGNCLFLDDFFIPLALLPTLTEDSFGRNPERFFLLPVLEKLNAPSTWL